jgi:xylulokinase
VLLGIDLGTSSVKAAVMAEDGAIEQVARETYGVGVPKPGWAETDPADWWLAVRHAVRRLDPKHLRRIKAIGLAGQMHGVVLTNADGRPLRPAIVWADSRSVGELGSYRRLSPRLRRLLANAPAAGIAGPTLLWIKTHESTQYLNARWALQPKDWLRRQLTGEIYTEPTDASATLLYDLVRDEWSQEVLRELDLRPDLLPDLMPSADVAGTLTQHAANELGLQPGLPVAAGAADTAASLLGHGVMAPGPVLLTIGTGAQLTSVRARFKVDRAMQTHIYRTVEPGKWYSMAATLNAGLALDWVRRLFNVEWDALYAGALEVPPGAGGVTFAPYLVGERNPQSDATARASWMGMGLNHRREHLFRAALEGVAFALRQAMEALETTGISVPQLLLAGGGTEGKEWRQLLADVLNRRLLALATPAGAARGAALLAGVSAGVWKTLGDAAAVRAGYELAAEPGPEADEYARLYEQFRHAGRG